MSGALDFASGFTQALGQTIVAKRQREQEQKDRQQRNAQALVHLALQSGQLQDIGDLPPGLVDTMFGMDGKTKVEKGKVDPRELLHHIVTPMLSGGSPSSGAAENVVDAWGPTGNAAPSETADDGAVRQGPVDAAPAAPAQRTIGGIPLLSPDAAATATAQRKANSKNAEDLANVQNARRMLPILRQDNPAATLDDAFAVMGINMRRGSQSLPQVGTLGDYIRTLEGEAGHKLTGSEYEAARAKWMTNSMGQWVERAAAQLGYTNAADARAQGDAAFGEVSALATKMQADAAAATGDARTRAVNTANMDKPADFNTSRENDVPVGTTPNQAAGQQVATPTDKTRRDSVESLKTELGHIKKDLLGVLPTTGSLGDLAPGAYITAKKRLPAYRTDFAKLESALNNIVNVAARNVGEQKGAQTEQDATRAESAIIQMRDSWLDPTKGDTQESAKARIDETIKVLDSILGKLPGQIVPTPKGGTAKAAPTATTTQTVPGAVIKNGELYINGQLVGATQ